MRSEVRIYAVDFCERIYRYKFDHWWRLHLYGSWVLASAVMYHVLNTKFTFNWIIRAKHVFAPSADAFSFICWSQSMLLQCILSEYAFFVHALFSGHFNAIRTQTLPASFISHEFIASMSHLIFPPKHRLCEHDLSLPFVISLIFNFFFRSLLSFN